MFPPCLSSCQRCMSCEQHSGLVADNLLILLTFVSMYSSLCAAGWESLFQGFSGRGSSNSSNGSLRASHYVPTLPVLLPTLHELQAMHWASHRRSAHSADFCRMYSSLVMQVGRACFRASQAGVAVTAVAAPSEQMSKQPWHQWTLKMCCHQIMTTNSKTCSDSLLS